MLKRGILFLLLFVLSAFTLASLAKAKEKPVVLYFFWSKSCPHCAKEKVFLKKLSQKYPEVIIRDFEVSSNSKNLELLAKAAKQFNVNTPGLVPFTAVGENHIIGYLDDQTSGVQIEEAVKCALKNRCQDKIAPLLKDQQPKPEKTISIPKHLNLPLIGKINIASLSLPVLSIILGLLDGFNPCAMWTLLFLISLLLGMKDRKRMWILGSAFITTSALVYFLIMSAWLNLFFFLGFITQIRIAVGGLALIAGIYSLHQYITNPEGGCKAASDKKRQHTFSRLKAITQKNNLFIALTGIILLALAVNIIELVCSAGLPAIFTQILSLSKLPSWQYYLYLFIYILFFMIDDLFVFFTAMITLKAVGIENKYSRLSKLIGGTIILIIGILLILKPEVLMFA